MIMGKIMGNFSNVLPIYISLFLARADDVFQTVLWDFFDNVMLRLLRSVIRETQLPFLSLFTV